MKKFGILIVLAAAILLVSNTQANNEAQKVAKPAPVKVALGDNNPAAPIMVTTKATDAPTTQSVKAAAGSVKLAQQPPTLEQVEQQMMSLYIEAGARVERIRVAQSELDQINQSVQQLQAYKAQLTGKAPVAAPAPKP